VRQLPSGLRRKVKARAVRTDVSDAAAVRAMIDTAVSTYGALGILINNTAFTHRSGPVWELDEAESIAYLRRIPRACGSASNMPSR
jgi:NAD(P)-dependent dehydrogenase (short-subunit alcohol dehydrogenase family)